MTARLHGWEVMLREKTRMWNESRWLGSYVKGED